MRSENGIKEQKKIKKDKVSEKFKNKPEKGQKRARKGLERG